MKVIRQQGVKCCRNTVWQLANRGGLYVEHAARRGGRYISMLH